MKSLTAAAAVIGLAASTAAYAAADAKAQATVGNATAQAKADYETAKARCKSVRERDRAKCASEADARYKAQLQGTTREHRDQSVLHREEPKREKTLAGAPPG